MAAAAKTRKTALLRSECLNAAAKLFAERGLGGTTLQDIADAVGIGRTGLYYYFASKEAILEALVEEVTLAVRRGVSSVVARRDLAPPELLDALVRHYGEWLLDHAIAFRVVDRTEKEFAPPLARIHFKAKRDVLDTFTAVITRGSETGQFRVAEPRIAAFAILGMCNWSAWWVKPTGPSNSRELAALFATFALNMVGHNRGPIGSGVRLVDAIGILRDDLSLLEQLAKRGAGGPTRRRKRKEMHGE